MAARSERQKAAEIMRRTIHELSEASTGTSVDDIESDLDYLRATAHAHALLEILPRIYSRDHPLVAPLISATTELDQMSKRIMQAFGEVVGHD